MTLLIVLFGQLATNLAVAIPVVDVLNHQTEVRRFVGDVENPEVPNDLGR
jgi:hypothetical protein